jgi:hypothetical protein
MKKLNSKIILLGLISMFCLTFYIEIARSSYVNKTDLVDYVDNNRESFYTQIYSKNNLKIDFAWNNDSNLLFFNYTNPISQIQIDSLLLNNSCEANSYKVIFSQNPGNITYYFIEIWLDRINVISSDNEYYIQINNEIPFRLIVKPITPESIPIPQENTFWRDFGWIITCIFVLFAIILFRLFMLLKNPYMYFRIQNEYTCDSVGRYVDSKYDENLKKWHYYFKSKEGIREIYSNLSYNDLENFALDIKNFLIGSLSGFHQLLPHVILKRIKVPNNVIIKKTKLDETKKVQKFFYEFLSFLPLKSIVYNLFKEIYVNTDDNLTEIEYLELEYSQETLEYKFNAKYKVEELNEKGLSIWVQKEENDIEYSKILSLEKSNIKDLKYEFSQAQIRKFNSIKEALQNRDSNDQLKSKYIVKELELSSQNKKLSDDNFDFYQQLRDLKDNFNSKLVENLKRFAQKSESLNENIPEMIGEIFYNKRLGMKDEETYSKALSKINEKDIESKKDTKSNEILEQNRLLMDKVVSLEKKIENQNLIGGDLNE